MTTKKRKLYLALCIVLIAVLAVATIISTKVVDKKSEPENSTAEGLPSIYTLDPNTTPWLYDFVNGSIGWHAALENDPSMTNMGFYYTIMFNQNTIESDPKIYTSWYSYGERITRPILGTEPKLLRLSKEQADRVLGSVDYLKRYRRLVTEGEWTFVFISRYIEDVFGYDPRADIERDWLEACNLIGMWMNIDLRPCQNDNDVGRMYKQVYEEGAGWPTSWLGNDVWYPILLKAGYDMKDPFWLEYNVDSFIIYKSDLSNAPVKGLKVAVAQLDRFRFNYGDGHDINVNLEQLQEVLKMYGYIRR